MKRDHWTNEEVIDILNGLKTVGKPNEETSSWNFALDTAITQFWDFLRPTEEYGAMAYNPETQEIVVVGPPLPR